MNTVTEPQPGQSPDEAQIPWEQTEGGKKLDTYLKDHDYKGYRFITNAPISKPGEHDSEAVDESADGLSIQCEVENDGQGHKRYLSVKVLPVAFRPNGDDISNTDNALVGIDNPEYIPVVA